MDDPLQETIEFLRRDALNLAMRNTDNHARNTAVQRTVDGVVRLTPLFDFAPMFMDPDIIARSCHWTAPDGRRLDEWSAIIDSLPLDRSERVEVTNALKSFAEVVGNLPEMARDCGVEEDVTEQCRRSIERQVKQLGSLCTSHEAHRRRRHLDRQGRLTDAQAQSAHPGRICAAQGHQRAVASAD